MFGARAWDRLRIHPPRCWPPRRSRKPNRFPQFTNLVKKDRASIGGFKTALPTLQSPTRPISVDVRIIAATNRDLEAAVAEGRFRSDMFYRLNVFPVHVPSLTERLEDIPPLVEHLVERFAKRVGRVFRTIKMNTVETLQSYDWPGNIRELQNVIERSVILSQGDVFSIDEEWRRRQIRRPQPTLALVASMAEREREIIEAALAESEGRVAGPSGAAAKLGIPRQTLDSKIASLQNQQAAFQAAPRWHCLGTCSATDRCE